MQNVYRCFVPIAADRKTVKTVVMTMWQTIISSISEHDPFQLFER